MSVTVWILTGQGPALGHGHYRRMQVLAEILRARQLTVELLARDDVDHFESAFDSFHGRPSPGDLCIVDARDVDPRPFGAIGPVIAVDNRHAARPTQPTAANDSLSGESFADETNIFYYDTLPHPAVDLSVVLERFLVAPELRALVKDFAHGRSAPGRSDHLLAYSGSARHVHALDEFLIRYARRYSAARVLRVGSAPLTLPANAKAKTNADADADAEAVPANFSRVDRMAPAEFYAALSASRYVLSYFGMTIFEAWHARATPLLYSIKSEIHDALSVDLAGRSGIPFLQNKEAFDTLEERLASTELAVGPGPDGKGYERLVELVESLVNSATSR